MVDMDFLDFDSNHLQNMFEYMETHRNVDGIFGMSFTKHYLTIPYV